MEVQDESGHSQQHVRLKKRLYRLGLRTIHLISRFPNLAVNKPCNSSPVTKFYRQQMPKKVIRKMSLHSQAKGCVHWQADVEQAYFHLIHCFSYSVGCATCRGFLEHRLVTFPLEMVTGRPLWSRTFLEWWRVPRLLRAPDLLNRCWKSWRCVRFTHDSEYSSEK